MNFIRTALVKAALNLIYKFLVEPIQYAPTKFYLEKRHDDLQAAAEKLTDADPNNVEQLKQLWEDIDEEFVDDTLLFAAKVVRDKVKDQFLAEQVATILEELAKEDLLDAPSEVEAVTVKENEPLQEDEKALS